MSATHPLRTLGARAIRAWVRIRAILDALSKRAPMLVAFALCAALLGTWSGAPDWLANGLAIIVGFLALALLSARGRQNEFRTAEELGSTRSGDWIAYELAGKGSPPGFYVLAFFGVLTIVLTGVQTPYALLAWAGFGLGIVWGIVNARYPADETSRIVALLSMRRKTPA